VLYIFKRKHAKKQNTDPDKPPANSKTDPPVNKPNPRLFGFVPMDMDMYACVCFCVCVCVCVCVFMCVCLGVCAFVRLDGFTLKAAAWCML
jgi:hypothetical protein